VIVGGDEVSYGARPPAGDSYKKRLLSEVGDQLDPARVHFIGKVPYQVFLNVLQVSSAHVYLTYPFVLSWSLLEAMAAECLLVASATAPVREVVEHEFNGLLVDFFDRQALLASIGRALTQAQEFQALRTAARQSIVERYDLKRVCLPRHRTIIDHLAAGKAPPVQHGSGFNGAPFPPPASATGTGVAHRSSTAMIPALSIQSANVRASL